MCHGFLSVTKLVQNFGLEKFYAIFAANREDMTLSIIVPIYNVAKHLVRCLDSIAMQMRDDYELLLIDDGSTDASGALCDVFAREHPECRVVVIHQPNGGLSAARNAGIDKARGEYITFVDSDDYIDPHTLEHNMDILIAHPEVDMLEYPIEVHAGSPKAHVLTFPDATQCADVFADWVLRGGYKHCYACNKIFRARVWSQLRFPVGEYFEDVAIMPSVIRECRQVHYSSRGCYRYVMHQGSITTSHRYRKQRALFEGNHRLYREIKDTPSLHDEALRLWVYCLNQLIDMGRCADADRVEHLRFVADADKYRPSYRALLGAAPHVATRIKLLPLLVLGLKNYCRLYITFTKPLYP